MQSNVRILADPGQIQEQVHEQVQEQVEEQAQDQLFRAIRMAVMLPHKSSVK